jgi:hypothetical protein
MRVNSIEESVSGKKEAGKREGKAKKREKKRRR